MAGFATCHIDYKGFREFARPYVAAADRGEYEVVIQKAIEIATEVRSADWGLEGVEYLGYYRYKRYRQEVLHPFKVGGAFLVMLGTFMTKTDTLHELPRWRRLRDLQWTEAESTLIFEGYSSTTIIKPELVQNPFERPPANDSRWHDLSYYWWCVRPRNAMRIHWWDCPAIEQVLQLLEDRKDNILGIDLSQIDHEPPLTKEMVQKEYDATIRTFHLALEKGMGIYSTLYA